MNRHFILFILTACLGSFSSFSEDLIITDHLMEELQPRALHAVWTYRGYERMDDVMKATETVKEEVIGMEEIDGQVCWKILAFYDGRTLLQKIIGTPPDQEDLWIYWEYFHRGSTYYFSGDDAGSRPGKPTGLGDFIQMIPRISETEKEVLVDGMVWKISATNKEVTVPAGTFNCVVFEGIFFDGVNRENHRDRFYFAREVGLVLWEGATIHDGKWQQQTRHELLKAFIPRAEDTHVRD